MRHKNPAENLIHIKFDYQEAINSKTDLLESQKNLLRVTKTINNYNKLRKEELKLKLRLYRKVKEMTRRLRKLHTTLPKIKIPTEILPKETRESKPTKKEGNKNIEEELKEIQKKINALQQ